MTLHRIRIRPRSPWRTPWHADTLSGMLCATAARGWGASWLRVHLIEPMLDGAPPFILSDACPGDRLPLPMVLRLQEVPDPTRRKALKQARWLDRADFLHARCGGSPDTGRWRPDPYLVESRRHNTLGRDTDASLDEGGLFTREEVTLNATTPNDDLATLSIYARVADADALDLLVDLLDEMALTGFGADTATGRGQFERIDEPLPEAELETPPSGTNALILLSTFQPAPGDPTDGLWEAFPRFGKLGPDLGVRDVRKRTAILFRPGACFLCPEPRPFLGHALTMDQILPDPTRDELRAREIEVIHPAFGLAVPASISEARIP